MRLTDSQKDAADRAALADLQRLADTISECPNCGAEKDYLSVLVGFDDDMCLISGGSACRRCGHEWRPVDA